MPDNFSIGLLSMGLACFAFWLYWSIRIKLSGQKKICIVTLTGPSGAGKTTIVGKLLEMDPGQAMIKSRTSREIRSSDLPGEYECNVPPKKFLQRRKEFLWVESAHGNLYGTLRADVDQVLRVATLSFMQLLPKTVKDIRAYAPGRVLSVFILPPNEEELRRRLKARGDSPEAIERRISDCKKWEEDARRSDIPYEFVRNDGTIEETVRRVEQVIKHRF